MSVSTHELSAQGVSIWLDDLSRNLVLNGGLRRYLADYNVVGVTTNPTIFAAALRDAAIAGSSGPYAEQLAGLAADGATVDTAVTQLTTTDVRLACDVLAEVYARTDARDGYVSLEVDPRLAHDTQGTIAAARMLWDLVDQPNLMIKIPATVEGLPAVTEVLRAGINVNVTLIFSRERYRQVLDAWLAGLQARLDDGHSIDNLASVASFFVSRVDALIDPILDQLATPAATALRGKAGVANARLAYQMFTTTLSEPAWVDVQSRSTAAQPQRPLWASTGVKDPAYPDTLYVSELVASNAVNTMPPATLEAVADHGSFTGDTVTNACVDAQEVLGQLAELDISLSEATMHLETEGVAKFANSWNEVLASVEAALAAVTAH